MNNIKNNRKTAGSSIYRPLWDVVALGIVSLAICPRYASHTNRAGQIAMKKFVSLLLCLCLMLGVMPALGENAQPYTEQPTPLWGDDGQIGSLDLRFYADKPHIAYIGIKAYMAANQRLDVAVEPQADGTWIVARPNGKTLVANPSEGTLYAEDWAGFQTPELPYVRRKTGIKDTDCGWTEVT